MYLKLNRMFGSGIWVINIFISYNQDLDLHFTFFTTIAQGSNTQNKMYWQHDRISPGKNNYSGFYFTFGAVTGFLMREAPGFTPGLTPPGVPGFDAAAAWNNEIKSMSAFGLRGGGGMYEGLVGKK